MRIPTTRSQPEFILTPTTIHHFPDIATDLTWVNMLKGIAIIGVFYDNWLVYCRVNGLIAVPLPFIFHSQLFFKQSLAHLWMCL